MHVLQPFRSHACTSQLIRDIYTHADCAICIKAERHVERPSAYKGLQTNMKVGGAGSVRKKSLCALDWPENSELQL